MKKLKLLIVTLLFTFGFILALQGCVVHEKKLQESGATLLSQSDLEQLFSVKHNAQFTTSQGYSVTVTYYPDGTQEYEGDTGKYRIKSGQMCSKWQGLRGGRENCYRLYKTGENNYDWVNLNGSYDSSMSIK